jgi:hypothetical protein
MRAALFLLVATGPLVEILSENVPLLTFLQPLPFLFVTLTYGVPVNAMLRCACSLRRKLRDLH